jgi:hypothetical protein
MGFEMAGVRDAKIRKKEYRFDIRRRFQNVKYYNLPEKSPMNKVSEALKSMFGAKKEEKKKKPRGAMKTSAEKPPPSGFNLKIIGAMIFVALLILGLGYWYISSQIQALEAPGVFEPELEKPEATNKITGGGVLTAGDLEDASHNAYVDFDITTSGIDNYMINITTYNEVVPSEIFVLKTERKEAITYTDFLREMRFILGKKGIMLNEITMDQLRDMPGGAIVIVPSGFIPKELLGFGDYPDFSELAGRGIVFIYVGQSFSSMLDDSLVVNTPQDVLDDLPIGFDRSASLISTGGFELFQPLYRASARGGGFESGMIYGSVSVLKKGSGAMILIPQTLDGGWRSRPKVAAEDVSSIIINLPWLNPTSQTRMYSIDTSGGFSDSTSLFSHPFDGTEASIVSRIAGFSEAARKPITDILITRVSKDPKGELYIEGGFEVVPTNITNNEVRVNARLDEPEPGTANMFLVISDSFGRELQRLPIGIHNVQAPINQDIKVFVDEGQYILSLVDDGGKTYAHAFMEVVSIDIERTYLTGLEQSEYAFDITMGGEPVELNEIVVIVNDGELGTYEFSDVSRVVVDVSAYTGGERLPFGNHTFEFTAGGLTKTLNISRSIPKSVFTDPFFLMIIFFAGGIAVVGIYFAKQDIIYYGLDVPDFPPVARTKVPLSSDVVMSVFDKVNESYQWGFAPLKVHEIRNGFQNVFYRGRPIYITDYNVEYLMDDLMSRKLVGTFMGYYCPLKWEKESGKSIRYLAMMRKLRDICVYHAVPFTKMDKSKNADSDIKVAGQDMYINFYDPARDMDMFFHKTLLTVGKGITIILFRNEAEKSDFRGLLNSPYKGPLIMKLEAEASSAQLLTYEEFEKMVSELKSV